MTMPTFEEVHEKLKGAKINPPFMILWSEQLEVFLAAMRETKIPDEKQREILLLCSEYYKNKPVREDLK